MNIYNDLKRIIDQLRGKSNMFEYQTTLANQAYLLYSLLGRIYTTDKIHRHTKLLILCAFATEVILIIAEIWFYFVFYLNEDLPTQMYALFIIFIIALMFVIVLMAHTNRHHIEATIKMVDKLVTKSPSNLYITGKQIKLKILLYISVFYISTMLPFLICCLMDVAIFYDPSKVKNNFYYIIPLPNLEQYGSLIFYVVSNVVASIAGGTVVYSTLTIMILPLMWVIVCHNEAQRIAHHLNSLGDNLHVTTESSASFERLFKRTIVRCVHDYRDVIKTVEYFRGYYETMANILLPLILYFEVAHVFIFMTTTGSYIVKLKELSACITLLQITYIYCWIGETLNEMTNAMSFAVYSTPWYRSTKVRKDAYIFLCQTQNSINPAAWRVYPLSLALFLRFMNVVQSSANVLRVIDTK